MKVHDTSIFNEDAEYVAWVLGRRVLRACGYGLLAYMLVNANPYGVFAPMYLVIAIGLLGLAGTSVKVGQVALVVLLVMAIIPEVAITALVQRF